MTYSTETDALRRIGWAVRHHRSSVVGVMVMALVLGWLASTLLLQPGHYRATALVVANTLEIPPAQLPRLASAVFTSGAVAEGVVADLGLDVDHRRLVPDSISVDPVADSVAVLVNGMADDAQMAVDLADAAARHFVDELNEVGPGVGTFSVQDQADVPLRRVAGLGAPLVVLVAGTSGVLLAVVLAAGLAWIQRPLLSASDAERVLGLPVLGTVSVGRRKGGGSRPELGVTAHPLSMRFLVQQLGSRGHAGVVLVGEPDTESARRAMVRPLREEMVLQITARPSPSRKWAHLAGSSTEGGAIAPDDPRHVVVVEDWDISHAPGSNWGVALVAREHAPSRGLAVLADEWRSDLIGVVLLRGQTPR